MTKTKTYWAVFTGRGSIMNDFDGVPLVCTTKKSAEDEMLFFSANGRAKTAYDSTVRKVKIVEVGK